jgi:glycosyltransferase involved in cell wall biosynthesis
MRSVLDQGYPNLEYIVIDGASSDDSLDIIRRYANRLAFWTSEPDGGMYSALNKGSARQRGRSWAG